MLPGGEEVGTMFTPIREGVFRWSTPDPADDWMMVGHLFVRETGVVLVDPPMVPGLLEAAVRLGKLEAVLLTEQNHTRASRFIAKRAGIPVYLPETIPGGCGAVGGCQSERDRRLRSLPDRQRPGIPGAQVRRRLCSSIRWEGALGWR